MNILKHIALAGLFLPIILPAQQKDTTKSVKPIPENRRFEITPPNPDLHFPNAQREKQNPDLPKIDLPEFVITGTALMELPEVSKLESDEDGAFRLIVEKLRIGERDRSTLEFVREQKPGYFSQPLTPMAGRVLASIATFTSPRADVAFGQASPEGYFLTHANLFSTKGHVPFSNRSAGSIDLSGGTTLESPSSWLHQNTLHARFGFSSQLYRFFGSPTPSLTRSTTAISIGSSLTSSPGEEWSYDYAMNYTNLSIKDSSRKTTENRIDLFLESSIPGSFIPLKGGIRFHGVTYSGGNSGSFPALDAMLIAKRLWWSNFFLQASGHLYLAQGMLNQSVTKIYPHLDIGARIVDGLTLTASYKGRVSFTSFLDLLQEQPYLGTGSLIQVPDIPVEISGSLDGCLGSWLEFKVGTQYQSIQNQPILSNPGNQGIWSFSYGGKTTWITYSADLIAKLSPNVYFAFAAKAHETTNSILDHRLPYVADVIGSGRMVYRFDNGISVTPQLDYIGKRSVDTFSDRRLPGYLLAGIDAQYAVHRSWKILLGVQNLFDTYYDEWQGYRGTPFTITIGAAYQW